MGTGGWEIPGIGQVLIAARQLLLYAISRVVACLLLLKWQSPSCEPAPSVGIGVFTVNGMSPI